MASSAAKAKRFRLDCRHAVQPGVEAGAGPRISHAIARPGRFRAIQGDSGRFRAIQGHPGTIRGPWRRWRRTRHRCAPRPPAARASPSRPRSHRGARSRVDNVHLRALGRCEGVGSADRWVGDAGASARSFLLTNEVDKAGGVKRVGRAREALWRPSVGSRARCIETRGARRRAARQAPPQQRMRLVHVIGPCGQCGVSAQPKRAATRSVSIHAPA
jgi:hypothetical protein